MAHIYAGILGPLAFLVGLARGIAHGGGTESVLLQAWLGLLALAAVGFVVGWIAERTVEESVRGRIVAELAARGETERAQTTDSHSVAT